MRWLFRHLLNRSHTIFFRDSILDQLVDCVWMGNIVDSADIISLFEDKVSITQYVTYESMSFDIDLQNTFHIHELDIIDEEETRMDEEDSMLRYEHQSSKIIDRVHN